MSFALPLWRWLRNLHPIDRRELPALGYFGALGFFFMAVFFIIKPLRDGLFLHSVGYQSEPFAKLATALAAVGIADFYAILTRKTTKAQQLLVVTLSFFCLFATWLIFYNLFPQSHKAAAWAMYILSNLYVTVMLATFWGMLGDICTPQTAKRLYPLVALAGEFGCLAGTSIVGIFPYDPSMLLPFLLIFGALLIVAGTVVAMIRWRPELAGINSPVLPWTAPAVATLQDLRLVGSMPLYRSLFGVLVCYEFVSTALDYQFKAYVTAQHTQQSEITLFLGKFYALIEGTTIALRLVATGPMLRAFKLRNTFIAVPLLLLASTLTYQLWPVLALLYVQQVIQNALHFAMHEPCKELCFTIIPARDVYRVKGIVDVLGSRLGKGLGAAATLLPSAIVLGFLGYAISPILAIWLFFCRRAGRIFDERENTLAETKSL